MVSDDAFDIAPKILAPEQASHVGPGSESETHELKRQPLSELVVFRVRVADEDHITGWHARAMLPRLIGEGRAPASRSCCTARSCAE